MRTPLRSSSASVVLVVSSPAFRSASRYVRRYSCPAVLIITIPSFAGQPQVRAGHLDEHHRADRHDYLHGLAHDPFLDPQWPGQARNRQAHRGPAGLLLHPVKALCALTTISSWWDVMTWVECCSESRMSCPKCIITYEQVYLSWVYTLHLVPVRFH